MANNIFGDNDAAVAAGAAGSISAKLRRLTTDLGALLTAITGGITVTSEPSGSGKYTTAAHTAPTAGVATGAILAANANRLYALVVNDSDTVVYLALGAAAALNTGIRLNANGGSYEMSAKLGNLYTGVINGISGVAGKVVLVTEGV
jgi:hypothetical protein